MEPRNKQIVVMVSQEERELIKMAALIDGVNVSVKAREYLLKWAEKTTATDNRLTRPRTVQTEQPKKAAVPRIEKRPKRKVKAETVEEPIETEDPFEEPEPIEESNENRPYRAEEHLEEIEEAKKWVLDRMRKTRVDQTGDDLCMANWESNGVNTRITGDAIDLLVASKEIRYNSYGSLVLPRRRQ